jgi:biotin transport system substrate-specific component
MLVGQVVIYALGLAGLLRFLPLEAALQAGILPFLPGDAVKLALAALALPGAWRLLGRPRA